MISGLLILSSRDYTESSVAPSDFPRRDFFIQGERACAFAGPYQRIKTQRKRTFFIERGSNPPFHTSCPVHCMRYAAGCRGNDASSVVAQLVLDIPYSLPS